MTHSSEGTSNKSAYPCPHGRQPIHGEDGWKHCPHCLGMTPSAQDPKTPEEMKEALAKAFPIVPLSPKKPHQQKLADKYTRPQDPNVIMTFPNGAKLRHLEPADNNHIVDINKKVSADSSGLEEVIAERIKIASTQTKSSDPIVQIAWLAEGIDLWYRSKGKRGNSPEDAQRYIVSSITRLITQKETEARLDEVKFIQKLHEAGVWLAPALVLRITELKTQQEKTE